MAQPKPRYAGNRKDEKNREFPESMREALRSYYPEDDTPDPVWGYPSGQFVSEILNEATWAAAEVQEAEREINNSDLKAEFEDLMKALADIENKLRSISPDLDRLLGDADPLGCADHVSNMTLKSGKAKSLIDDLPFSWRAEQKNKRILDEMAIRVLSILKTYGIKLSATYDTRFANEYKSPAVAILEILCKNLDSPFAEKKLRKMVSTAKTAIEEAEKKCVKNKSI